MQLGAVALVSLGLAVVLLLRTRLLTPAYADFALPMDHHKYLRMATEGVLDFHIAPYAWRVGLPLLARSLPVDVSIAFFLVTFLSIWLTGPAIYLVGRAQGFAPSVATFGVLAYFALGWGTKFVLYDFWLPDALAFLIITLAIWAILTRRDMLALVLLAAGVTVKESVIFVAPLLYTLRATRLFEPRLALRAALLTAPAVLALVAIRRVIPQLNDVPDYIFSLPLSLRLVRTWDGAGGFYSTYYDFGWMLRELAPRRLLSMTGQDLVAWTVGPFGVPLVTLPWFDVRRSAALLLRYLPFIALVYAQLLFTWNSERLLVAAFPAVMLLALAGVAAIGHRWRVPIPLLWGLPLLMFGLHVSKVDGGFSEPVLVEALITAAYLGALRVGAQRGWWSVNPRSSRAWWTPPPS